MAHHSPQVTDTCKLGHDKYITKSVSKRLMSLMLQDDEKNSHIIPNFKISPEEANSGQRYTFLQTEIFRYQRLLILTRRVPVHSNGIL